MASTNKTPEYELSQFIATDKPAWLSDYNGDMLKIDTGIAEAKAVADAAAATAGNVSSVANNALDAAQAADTKADALVTTVNAVDDKAESALDASSAASSAATQAASDAAAASTAASAAQTAADNAMSRANSAYTLANGKQNALTFDSTPTAGSSNPVTSGGIYTALQNIQPSASGVEISYLTNMTVSNGGTNLDANSYRLICTKTETNTHVYYRVEGVIYGSSNQTGAWNINLADNEAGTIVNGPCNYYCADLTKQTSTVTQSVTNVTRSGNSFNIGIGSGERKFDGQVVLMFSVVK